jgi:hypothetical protein
VKRSRVVDATGGPLGTTSAEANGHDTRRLATTLESTVVDCPPTAVRPQHLCWDKGDPNPTGRTRAGDRGIPHRDARPAALIDQLIRVAGCSRDAVLLNRSRAEGAS